MPGVETEAVFQQFDEPISDLEALNPYAAALVESGLDLSVATSTEPILNTIDEDSLALDIDTLYGAAYLGDEAAAFLIELAANNQAKADSDSLVVNGALFEEDIPLADSVSADDSESEEGPVSVDAIESEHVMVSFEDAWEAEWGAVWSAFEAEWAEAEMQRLEDQTAQQLAELRAS